ncbi:hypothetical protein LXL04_016693 [Taraxacum kok-saghyz]
MVAGGGGLVVHVWMLLCLIRSDFCLYIIGRNTDRPYHFTRITLRAIPPTAASIFTNLDLHQLLSTLARFDSISNGTESAAYTASKMVGFPSLYLPISSLWKSIRNQLKLGFVLQLDRFNDLSTRSSNSPIQVSEAYCLVEYGCLQLDLESLDQRAFWSFSEKPGVTSDEDQNCQKDMEAVWLSKRYGGSMNNEFTTVLIKQKMIKTKILMKPVKEFTNEGVYTSNVTKSLTENMWSMQHYEDTETNK